MEYAEQSGRSEYNLNPEAITNIRAALSKIIVPFDKTRMIEAASAGLSSLKIPEFNESQLQSIASTLATAGAVIARYPAPDLTRINDALIHATSKLEALPTFKLEEALKNYEFPQLDTERFSKLLESARAFEEEFGGTEVEESANEFLENNADVAEQILNSPFLYTLTLQQRRLVSGYLALLVYIVFVSTVAFGESAHPEVMDTLEILGINIAPITSAAVVYKSSRKALDKHMSDPDENV